ncbi:MAG: sigma-70 family RNA polymerase sigma factor, partial [Clostridia bacterium]|nr:sigma-70 family RNA polymerase sigma factor [Clostridia bacterium]
NDLEGRDRTIIYLRYFKQKTQTEIAERLGISQVQVSRIEKKLLERMREKIGTNDS